jgi:6-phosphofructokinase
MYGAIKQKIGEKYFMKHLLVAQSGGPTAVINSTLAGVIEEAMKSNQVDKVYGTFNGIDGVLNENFTNLSELFNSKEQLYLLQRTPASALGSCRHKLEPCEADDSIYKKIIQIFQKNNIGYFIYIGGNDSMDTVDKLSKYCELNRIHDVKIIGAPKTIDNDLAETDHCPGFGSAAKYIATTIREIICDSSVYENPSVTIIEIMGRNTGWLTAASALAKNGNNPVPQLIYLCERVFDVEKFITDVKNSLQKSNTVIIAISEGLKDSDGNYIGENIHSGREDAFGHKCLSGAGRYLEQLVDQKIGCKVRSIELNVMQRCASHLTSATDLEESKTLGKLAVSSAIKGMSGKMTAMKRKSNFPYEIEYATVNVQNVANIEKRVPLDWINPEGNGITKDMLEYLFPLIQGEVDIPYVNGLPKYFIFSSNPGGITL